MKNKINVNEWDGEETFNHIENIMVDEFPGVHSLIQKVLTTAYEPTKKEVAEAISLDLFGFIPK